jgi:hypothetical protein
LTLHRHEEHVNASRTVEIHARTLEVLKEPAVTDRFVAEGVVVPARPLAMALILTVGRCIASDIPAPGHTPRLATRLKST